MFTESQEPKNFLKILSAPIRRMGDAVEIRGAFDAGFLYVTDQRGAIEASVDEGSFFHEFWEAHDEESLGEPVAELNVPTTDDVLQEIARWMTRTA